MTIYAVGDVHGQLDMLRAAHDRIEADRAREGTRRAPVVFVGDYTDRGPDSKGVLSWLVEHSRRQAGFVCLAGNHDRMMLAFVDSGYEPEGRTARLDWLNQNLGGRATLESYGVDPGRWRSDRTVRQAASEAVPEDHKAFLRGLSLTHKTKDCFFCHAGIDPERNLDDQAEEDLLWIREPFLDDPRDHGRLIVHGHTPVRQIDHAGNRINIDTGAGYGRQLSAVVLEGREAFELTSAGRTPLNRR